MPVVQEPTTGILVYLEIALKQKLDIDKNLDFDGFIKIL